MKNLGSENLDQVFRDEITKVSDFKFGTTVVNVFDDMVSRSVPYYNEMQRMLAEIAADHVKEGTFVYDLGCSTGTTLIGLDQLIPSDIRFIGIDESQEMLDKCDVKLKEAGFVRPYDLVAGDLHQQLPISNGSVVILCLTLQFVRPLYRERLLRNIYEGLNPGGVLLLVEKVLAESSVFNRDFIKYYYNYKRRNHYSELEISQKREALENVLIPYKLSENMLLLKEAGFADCEIFFKWYNFSGMIAYKKS
ncbi:MULTISPECIES: carboxy-S-adenosyl-L-methionine synthase CmoA [Dyadobacter]|jgi:tRNA (cmo5U34)-methyltransferase|uniref:Carboxy-S-adenosyl-L-methionine synthase n=2 Tax=Dyadobacter TaxID=120831 RepID=A0A2P8FWH6_9BACT|nr:MULTISPECIES: carboxy-S-adenosyl-L-methionine synthase CmoA [Dyadobacter]HWV32175.1 carboxy-S-adenosyl-L-methionine synthase CmoA [Dyadobacter sp.]MDR6807294.1 tRNA (cmo5U34)-methyltransferase [Dyadobacter fermentans]MDR7045035.1 tRNA (cmo5U34)-methyltransferase [Dyadobacter sp. BE242]MDR7199229.1 tRNA (cmo5U34)-methyltransferase [Dyadobacter sp. BE34]MDR7217189.1 tRNA (cmo5U34)-methyltransferase [Dyadobacter sp. BE31]